MTHKLTAFQLQIAEASCCMTECRCPGGVCVVIRGLLGHIAALDIDAARWKWLLENEVTDLKLIVDVQRERIHELEEQRSPRPATSESQT